MNFVVELLSEADSDLDQIFAWIYERSPQGARAWHARWLEALDALEDRAYTFGRAPEDARHELDLRQIIFKTKHGKPYRAIFTIKDATVFVFCILGHGRDLVDTAHFTLPE